MKMEIMYGESIYSAVERAKEEACLKSYGYVDIKLNDIHLRVSHNSLVDDILGIYALKCKIRDLERFFLG